MTSNDLTFNASISRVTSPVNETFSLIERYSADLRRSHIKIKDMKTKIFGSFFGFLQNQTGEPVAAGVWCNKVMHELNSKCLRFIIARWLL